MGAPSRNGPCPCGSGTKYKKCCLAKDEAARLAAAPPPPRHRVVTHRGRPLLVSGDRDLSPDVLDHAVDYYEAKERGDGPAAQMLRFARPLLDVAGDDTDRMDRAFTLGTVFWNLALCEGERREEMLGWLIETIATHGEDGAELRALAGDMIERHRAMFPELHRGQIEARRRSSL